MHEDPGGVIIWYTIKWLPDGSVSVWKLTFSYFFSLLSVRDAQLNSKSLNPLFFFNENTTSLEW